MAERIAGALPEGARRGRVLVLGFEELMYAPLALGVELERRMGGADVRFSTTTRSPVLAVTTPVTRSAPALSSRRTTIPPISSPTRRRPGSRTTSRAVGFDAVVAVVDSVADTPRLHAQDGLLAQLAAHTGHVLPGRPSLPTVPRGAPAPERSPMLPEPLRGPEFSSYAPEDVGWLLQDLSAVTLEAPTEDARRRYRAVARTTPSRCRSSTSRASATRRCSTPRSTPPPPASPRRSAPSPRSSSPSGRRARSSWCRWPARALPSASSCAAGPRTGTASTCRTTPCRSCAARFDANALRWLAAHHDPADVVFVDGWTGKGAITRELDDAIREFEAGGGAVGFSPEIAVLADPGSCVRTYGTREDFLIPSACLNSTVSGLISRTVLRADLVGPDDFHGAKFYRELADADVSGDFVDAVVARFDDVTDAVEAQVKEALSADRTPTWEGWAAVERISEEYGIHDVNLVKPGVGETTRVLLRRVPWKILARAGAGADLDHIRLLAEQRGVPVEEVGELPYSCVGLIHPKYTRGATGADGKAVAASGADDRPEASQ